MSRAGFSGNKQNGFREGHPFLRKALGLRVIQRWTEYGTDCPSLEESYGQVPGGHFPDKTDYVLQERQTGWFFSAR
jgi:hypothetical protein